MLEVLREPLESGRVTISRAARQASFPARFQLVASMNPCPCGHLGETTGRACRCTQDQVSRYRGRISGPLLDRIDMHIEVPRLDPGALDASIREEEPSAVVQERVEAARRRQLARGGCPNSALFGVSLEQACVLDPESRALLRRAMEQLGLSARAYHRILRLARTIADLEQAGRIGPRHISEAIGYRRLDRQGPARAGAG
ncbi:MAG: competence protein [Candidatus Sedimenticola endophacoides]|nr:MAG: competence protein [Candidatus Sedimenticola endophacoides]